jgi:glycine/D-amino acid oxidase-like deaminating enzyme
MQNDERSHGLWERTAPPAPQTSALTGDLDVDVVVIGAGFTGCSAALHLAEGGARVAVLEAVEIGFGGSGRNVGLVNAGLWVMPDDMVAALGPACGEKLLTLLGDAPNVVFSLIEKHKIECEAQRTGTLHCAIGAGGLREIEEREKQWLARGAPVRLLDAAEAAAKIGSAVYTGALLDARAGTIQPLAYVRGLARAAIGTGARIFTNSPVQGAVRNGSRWQVSTSGGCVTADWIVVATNAYTNVPSPWQDLRTELVRLPYFQFATEPLSATLRAKILPERQGAWDTAEVLSSFRFDRAGRLLFGSVGALRGTGAPIHRAWARRAIRKIFPMLADVSFEAEWYGWIGMTDDNLPRFHLLAPNVLSISGYNGRGIGPGTVFGKVLAHRILHPAETDLPLPVRELRAQKFRTVKSAVYEAGAQFVHLIDGRL